MAALDGLRILDMTQYEAGPSCTQALAWLGADVVKIERPGTGDPGRGVGGGDSEYFLMWNSNKKSVTLALETEAGRDVLMKMLPHYDVFVENYGPGVVEKLGLDYEEMKKVHPSVIYARVKGFGSYGPYSDYKCFDMVAQAAAGAFSITGEADGPPMRPGTTVGDTGTGMQLGIAILAAYVHRLKTGEGQLVELSMQEAMTYYLRTAVAESRGGNRVTPRTGNGANPLMTLYPCKPGGPNDHIFVMAVTPRMWHNLRDTIDPALKDDERFQDAGTAIANADALREIITGWTMQYDKHEAMERLAAADVPASAVMDTVDIFHDKHLVERGFIKEVEHDERGPIRLLGQPIRLSESQVEIEAAAPLGKHTGDVVAADLGLSDEELQALRESGAFG